MERTRGRYPAPPPYENCGGEIGSTHIVKVQSFIRYGNHRYRANFINAKTQKARRVAANVGTALAVAA
jgi:hypothetical protein